MRQSGLQNPGGYERTRELPKGQGVDTSAVDNAKPKSAKPKYMHLINQQRVSVCVSV